MAGWNSKIFNFKKRKSDENSSSDAKKFINDPFRVENADVPSTSRQESMLAQAKQRQEFLFNFMAKEQEILAKEQEIS